MPNESCDIVGHQLDAEGSIDVGRPPMALQIDGDDSRPLASAARLGPNISIAPRPP